MITSLLLDKEPRSLTLLENKIMQHCPSVQIAAATHSLTTANDLIRERKPDLVFLDVETGCGSELDLAEMNATQNMNVVFLTKETNSTLELMKKVSIQYLVKPIQTAALVDIVDDAIYSIQLRKEKMEEEKIAKNIPFINGLIGVPTMEGYEFIAVQKIIRCEGLQKCTRIITQDRSDIVSSYNLGVFKKLLQPFGFFLPHKSFLINLSLIKKFHKEGTITMIDNGYVPLARRKRTEFLSLIRRM